MKRHDLYFTPMNIVLRLIIWVLINVHDYRDFFCSCHPLVAAIDIPPTVLGGGYPPLFLEGVMAVFTLQAVISFVAAIGDGGAGQAVISFVAAIDDGGLRAYEP